MTGTESAIINGVRVVGKITQRIVKVAITLTTPTELASPMSVTTDNGATTVVTIVPMSVTIATSITTATTRVTVRCVLILQLAGYTSIATSLTLSFMVRIDTTYSWASS
jgi:hypothetical protein